MHLRSTIAIAACAAIAGAAACGSHGSSGASEQPVVSDRCTITDTSGAPLDLSCTGLYTDAAMQNVSPSARPYTPGAVLWSDGAEKQRWIYLPEGATIDTTDPDDWVFPVGTKTWKQFVVNGRRVETRYFQKVKDDKWVRATYLWSTDETSAVRYDNGKKNVDGSTYEIPDTATCDKCHEGKKDRILGFEAIGLASPNAEGITLDGLLAERRLDPPFPADAARIPDDATGTARAALAYMHVNCGTSCHNRSDNAKANSTGLRLRVEVAELVNDGNVAVASLDPINTTVNVPTKTAIWAGTKRVIAGDPDDSLLFQLVNERGQQQMPPVISHEIDPNGVALIRAWIQAIPTTLATEPLAVSPIVPTPLK